MGQKLYEQSENGIWFKSKRKAFGVDVPAYVYDLWMPLIGSDAVGVLGVYYRLERSGKIYGLSLARIARACRIGVDKLDKINDMLVDCGFVEINKPTGWQRLAHYTTEIITLDAPTAVSAEMIQRYAPTPRDGKPYKWVYEPLTEWLVEEYPAEHRTNAPENLNGFSGDPEQVDDKNLNGFAKIDPSFDPSSFESLAPGGRQRTIYGPSDTDKGRTFNERENTDPEDDNDKVQYTDFQAFLISCRHGQKHLAPSYRKKLDQPANYWNDAAKRQESAIPSFLWENDPLYKRWLTEKKKPECASFRWGMETLVNAVCNLANFYDWRKDQYDPEEARKNATTKTSSQRFDPID